jgi:hypothetical protein
MFLKSTLSTKENGQRTKRIAKMLLTLAGHSPMQKLCFARQFVCFSANVVKQLIHFFWGSQEKLWSSETLSETAFCKYCGHQQEIGLLKTYLSNSRIALSLYSLTNFNR